MKTFVHLSNGDYNGEDCGPAEIEWELDSGGQRYVIITKKRLSSDDYMKICEILDKYYPKLLSTLNPKRIK